MLDFIFSTILVILIIAGVIGYYFLIDIVGFIAIILGINIWLLFIAILALTWWIIRR